MPPSDAPSNLIRYFAVAFGLGWALMGLGIGLQSSGGPLGQGLFTVAVALAMFAPMLGVLVACGSLRSARTGIGWHPRFPGNGRRYVLAWFGPAALMVICAGLYFAIFPGQLDIGFGYLTDLMASAGAAEDPPQLAGLPMWVMALATLAQAITFAPPLNALFAVGEEAGWRGFMTPELTRRFGRTGGLLIGGVVWGVWHWPLIIFAGYEYGTGYVGAPVTGMLAMCLFTTALAILLSFLYERSGTIWIPALAHGALNACAAAPLLAMPSGTTGYLLGPTIAGLISVIPVVILALLALRRPSSPGEATFPTATDVGKAKLGTNSETPCQGDASCSMSPTRNSSSRLIASALVAAVPLALALGGCAAMRQGTLYPGASDPGAVFAYRSPEDGRDKVFAGAFVENKSAEDSLVLEPVTLESPDGLTLVDAYITSADQQLSGALIPVQAGDDYEEAWNAKVPLKGYVMEPGDYRVLALVIHKTVERCGRADGFKITYTQYGQEHQAEGVADVVVFAGDKYEDYTECGYEEYRVPKESADCDNEACENA
jgi:membrane protease YdiL (CAAX protease family)